MEKLKNLKIIFADNRKDSSVVDLLQKIVEEKIEIISYDSSDKPDLIVFTGGEDVTPSLYGENRGSRTGINENRDKTEKYTFQKYVNIPKLGICRGSQFLTVMNKGKLIQHVENHTSEHTIETIHDQIIKVTSTHHQMMYPFNLNRENFELIAWSEYFRSKVYLDGNDKQKEIPGEFLEPEIVFYPNTKSLAIQGHPEYGHASKEFVELTLKLVLSKLFNKEIKFTEDKKLESYSFGNIQYLENTKSLTIRRQNNNQDDFVNRFNLNNNNSINQTVLSEDTTKKYFEILNEIKNGK